MNALLLMLSIVCADTGDVAGGQESSYDVTVCLRPSDHPMLTPLFVESIADQVRDQMSNYFGAMANMDVRTADHWLLDEFLHQPIDSPDLSPGLLAQRNVTGKIFLIGVDYHNGFYQISWRQLDGSIQQIDAIRRRTTPDRQWVGKAICLAIKNDFSLIATVKPAGSNTTVAMEFLGSHQPTRLMELLGTPCIMRTFWVLRQRGYQEKRPIPNTYLYLDQDTGVRKARVITNLSNPFPQRAVIAGYEAMRMNTQTGRLRLRIIAVKTGLPVLDCSVSASDKGFDAMQAGDILNRPDRDGFVLSDREFAHLAYVQVTHGASRIRLPIPITADLTEQVVRVHVDRTAGEKEEFQRDVRFLIQDTQSILSIQADAVSEFNELNQGKRYEEALKRVQAAMEFVDPRITNALRSLVELKERSKQMKAPPGPLLQAAEQQVTEAQKRNTELGKLQTVLGEAVKKRDAQGRANVVIQLGQQAEMDGDIDEAIMRYELALNEQPDQPQLRDRLEKLKQAWRIQGPEHERARKFVYDSWGKAEVTEMAALLPEVRRVFETLKSCGDDLTARRLSSVNSEQLGHLNAIVDQLAQRATADDQDELDKYVKLTEELASLQTEVAKFVEQALIEGMQDQPDAAAGPDRGAAAPDNNGPANGGNTPVPPGTDELLPPLSLEEEEEAPIP